MRPLLIVSMAFLLFGSACSRLSDQDGTWDRDYGPAAASELIAIPAGTFWMGSNADPELDAFSPGVDEGFSDEHPLHRVDLRAYAIERTEVANAQYRACVDANACDDPFDTSSRTRSDYYLNPAYDAYPVVHVSWHQAAQYCAWLGRRLPTEAEWEKAARGTGVRRYPWGDSPPDCLRANLHLSTAHFDTGGNFVVDDEGCAGDTEPVADYDYGASPFSVQNLSGNVFEWVADYYAANYYDTAMWPDNADDPTGPETGERRVIRGGSFMTVATLGRTAYRSAMLPESSTSDLGFRCAADVTD
ncbi:MAG: formylglycine-generating enzyme family protein [Deltaproteobacteria bacterium]|nr:formylglycine-generating enzyme family protein [Deltaproteobacteria bacterium]